MDKRLLLAIALAATACTEADLSGSEPVTADPAAALSARDLPELLRKAEAGDLQAANTPAVYYDAVDKDDAQRRRWLRFAGERGDCNALAVLHEEHELLRAEMETLKRRHNCTDQ